MAGSEGSEAERKGVSWGLYRQIFLIIREVIWGFVATSGSRDDEEGPIYDGAESGSTLEGGVEEAKVI